MKRTTLPLKHSTNPGPFRLALLLIPFAFACFALSPQARAVDPPPDGGYPGANTAEGDDALLFLTTGILNTAVGFNALMSNTEGDSNTAIGALALQNNTTGTANTVIGVLALASNTTGLANTASGLGALFGNLTGSENTANGNSALASNATGSMNTATGLEALFSNTIGNSNSANGWKALFRNTTGDSNTANGLQALFANTTGNENTANGVDALLDNGTGNGNTATGSSALSSNRGGDNNTATGHDALLNNTTGSYNIALGAEAGGNLTTGNSNIDIGNRGVAGEANTIRIGAREKHTNTFIAGISGVTVPTGVPVIIDIHGHLGTTTSSARFKEAIKPMDKASEAILALKPVTFRYKHDLDPEGIPQFGLLAEDAEKVNPDLVARDEQGKPYTVRYEAVNAMLLNEFLKEHATVQELKKEIATLKAGLQKVSAQLEVSKSAPQTVLNNQ